MMKKLANIPEKNPFRVPEGYFEDVNRKIISATSGKNNADRRSGFSFPFRPYLLVAASVAGLILLSYSAMKVIATYRSNQQQEAGTIPEEYTSAYFNELDVYSLEEKAASLLVPEHGPDVSKAEIIDYLILDNIEIDDIYEQL